MPRTVARTLAIWVVIGFLANFAWEMLHMPLYVSMEGGWQRCLWAAAADVAILGWIYALMACTAETWLWFQSPSLARTAVLIALGSLTAAVFELRALAAGEWSYTPAMPLVPFLGVGWSPILQMMVIPVGLAWLSRRAATSTAGARVRH